jgi:hypothetical protein
MRIRSLALLLLATPALALAQRAGTTAATDTIRAGRWDMGRMWTFENPPVEEFRQYGFSPDSAWFERARMAALRIPGCSASFVSRDGLMITNHHCARSGVVAVQRAGETLLDSGFVAHAPAEERRIPNYYADQLIAVQDVSDEVNRAVDAAPAGAARDSARARVGRAVQARLRARYANRADSLVIQVVTLYSGGRTSAYVFRRFTDIRLVVAPELQMGFFGGDWDNFTYPRYALDFAILRAYGADGKPLRTTQYFGWGGAGEGVKEGDAVFVIGNPGQTSRLTTMGQLAYARDLTAPVQLAFLNARIDAMREFQKASPEEAERWDIRNRIFGLTNTQKSLGGRLLALNDAAVMARRADTERMLLDSIRAHPELRARYGQLVPQIAALQREKMADAQAYRGFAMLLTGTGGSAEIQRAFWRWRAAHATGDSVKYFTDRGARVAAAPAGLETRFLALALADIRTAYGARSAIGLAAGAAKDSAGIDRLVALIAPRMIALQANQARLAAREQELAGQLGRARYAVYGASIPPDGSFSLRIADGVVKGYPYNGSWAAPFTTFYGMYDRNRANGQGTDWELPNRWRTPPAGLDLGTPLNFVSTADSYGGNSGSPVVTKELKVVGLNFDRNIEALVRDYIYLPERGRNVMVDVRAVHQALEHAYGAGWVVRELVNGGMNGN